MKKALVQFVFAFSIVILLSSCSDGKKIVDLNLKYVSTKAIPGDTTDRDSQAQLAEAATAIGQSMQELSAMQLAIQPGNKMPKPIDTNLPGMGQLASANWTGPVEPFLRKLAQSVKYKIRVIGREPVIPVLISLNMRNQPVATILRNTTYQVVTKANVMVYPNTRTIELRYHGN